MTDIITPLVSFLAILVIAGYCVWKWKQNNEDFSFGKFSKTVILGIVFVAALAIGLNLYLSGTVVSIDTVGPQLAIVLNIIFVLGAPILTIILDKVLKLYSSIGALPSVVQFTETEIAKLEANPAIMALIQEALAKVPTTVQKTTASAATTAAVNTIIVPETVTQPTAATWSEDALKALAKNIPAGATITGVYDGPDAHVVYWTVKEVGSGS